ncbi:MAG: preprotein translocase subunit YajC [Deltaproteobacteria bacterium]|nr:MAG: preprotein translocase subunit YajC [Deltaproteobacteria bacterium]
MLAQENLGSAPAAGGGGAAGAAAPTGGAPPGGPACGGGEQLLFMLGMLVLFYFLLIRPQQKRAKRHRELIGGLKRGDRVITSSGIYGRIEAIDGNVLTVEIAKNTKIKILKNYVGGIANQQTEQQLAQSQQSGS